MLCCNEETCTIPCKQTAADFDLNADWTWLHGSAARTIGVSESGLHLTQPDLNQTPSLRPEPEFPPEAEFNSPVSKSALRSLDVLTDLATQTWQLPEKPSTLILSPLGRRVQAPESGNRDTESETWSASRVRECFLDSFAPSGFQKRAKSCRSSMSRLSTCSLDLSNLSSPDKFKEAVRDLCVIIIGQDQTALKLAKRRTDLGGRLVLLWTSEPSSGAYHASEFSWCPPASSVSCARSSIRKLFGFLCHLSEEAEFYRIQFQLASHRTRRFCKMGPDIVQLSAGTRYEVSETQSKGKESLGGVRVFQGRRILWEVSGHVVVSMSVAYDATDCVDLSVGAEYAKPLSLPDVGRCVLTMIFVFLFLCSALYLESERLDRNGGRPLWKIHFWIILVPFGCGFVDDWAGLALCGKSANGKAWKIVTSAMLVSIGIFLSCIKPITDTGYMTDFGVCGFGVLGWLGVCLPIHCIIVQRWPQNWLWCLILLILSLGMWFLFYGLCCAALAISRSWPLFGAFFLPMSLAATESLSVLAVCYATRHFYYTNGLPGDQLSIVVTVISAIHAFAEASRLSAAIVGGARQGSYFWVVTALFGFVLNLSTRFCWTRFIAMHILRIFSPDLAHVIRPSLYTRVHSEIKFLMGYCRFIAPFAVVFVRCARHKTPLHNPSALLALISFFLLECLEDAIVRLELLPYPNPSRAFPKLVEFSKDLGRFDPLQCHTWSFAREDPPREDQCSSRPLALHGTRALSWLSHFICVVPSCLFPYCLLQLVLGAGFISGRCASPISDPLSQALYWDRPLPC